MKLDPIAFVAINNHRRSPKLTAMEYRILSQLNKKPMSSGGLSILFNTNAETLKVLIILLGPKLNEIKLNIESKEGLYMIRKLK